MRKTKGEAMEHFGGALRAWDMNDYCPVAWGDAIYM